MTNTKRSFLFNQGFSFGLEYDLIYGRRGEKYAVWNRHTGDIHSEHDREFDARTECEKANGLSHWNTGVDYDSVP